MQALFDNIAATLTAPFVGELDLTHLFLLVGLVLIFVAIWAVILYYVRMAGHAVAEAV